MVLVLTTEFLCNIPMHNMKIIITTIFVSFFIPHVSLANSGQEKSLTGTVTKLYGNQVLFKTANAVVYAAETSSTLLVRKNGTPMHYTDFVVGDKIEVRGRVWSDNSVSATYMRDLTLYVHNGTFTGKIVGIDQTTSTIALQGAQYGVQTIHTNLQTVYMKNSSIVPMQNIVVGMSATIKGTWERTRSHVTAREVRATVRLLNIDVTGQLVLKDGLALTVVSDGVLYAVDASTAKVKSKNNKSMTVPDLALSTVRVQGKHIQESPHITASTIKDLTTIK